MTEFLTFQSIVQYRQAILEDGRLGTPEILKKFTTEIKGTHKQVKRKPRELTVEKSEVIEI